MPSPGPGRAQKSPEMDVSGRDKQNLKTGAPNSQKQKNESISKIKQILFILSISEIIYKVKLHEVAENRELPFLQTW